MTAVIREARLVDAPAIEAILQVNELPVDGVADRLGTTVVATIDGQLIGTAALELFADGALLRSVAVATERRSTGAGSRLVNALLALAEERGVRAVYLLTTTAETYFPRFGFTRIDRETVPATVRQSVEFTSACPASAIAMRKQL